MRRNPRVLRGFFRSADSFAALRFLSLLAAKVSEIVSRTSRLRCTSPRQADEDEDESGTTPTTATGLFNHKIQIYFDFVM
jgi:hypothetical protein